ncbi:methyltransferase domain-containing protein [Colletotrichum tofieldiae]|nr:methyltransferase domain-containing protein [Colletotrichum tofieldiae]GKT73365.1 methyltransferase domain-containing protein [Colletotrichum tofieldiae]
MGASGEPPANHRTPPSSPGAAPAATSPPAPVTPVVSTGPAQLEVDDAASDNASTIDDRISSYTASLSSSVVDYPEEYGRRYHAYRAGSYRFPNDETEMDRLDMNHSLMVRTIGNRLFLAPIEEEKTHRILDVGTGTGIWAVEMGDLFPNAEIIGNDLSAIQPGWVPPNVKFEIDDVESPWFEDMKYDFIFSRYMAGSLSDWPKYVGNVYKGLNNGGWAEFQDYSLLFDSDDGTLTDKHDSDRWHRLFCEICEKIDREHSPGPKLERWVHGAGFKNIVHHHYKIPIGPWAKDQHYKDLGMLNLIQMLDGLEGFSLKLFCGVLGWTREEVLVLLANVRREMKTNAYHAHLNFHVVYGQKVEEEGEQGQEQE